MFNKEQEYKYNTFLLSVYLLTNFSKEKVWSNVISLSNLIIYLFGKDIII